MSDSEEPIRNARGPVWAIRAAAFGTCARQIRSRNKPSTRTIVPTGAGKPAARVGGRHAGSLPRRISGQIGPGSGQNEGSSPRRCIVHAVSSGGDYGKTRRHLRPFAPGRFGWAKRFRCSGGIRPTRHFSRLRQVCGRRCTCGQVRRMTWFDKKMHPLLTSIVWVIVFTGLGDCRPSPAQL